MASSAFGFALPDGGYLATGDSSLLDIWRHFTTRGHNGPVQCVDAVHHVDILASGGMDYTTRVWKYDPKFDAYDLIAMVVHEAPPQEEGGQTVSTRLPCPLRKLNSLLFREKHQELDNQPACGITAVACVWSMAASETVGRIGPVISGTAHGDLTLLCVSAAAGSDNAVECLLGLHKGVINDICAAPTYPDDDATGLSFFIMTASDDMTSVLLLLECRETDNPNFSTHKHVDRNPFVDVMFCGGGGRAARRAAREKKAKTQASTLGMDPDEARTCLQYASVTKLATCQHVGEVLSVRHLGDNRKKDCALFATLTIVAANLWSSEGNRLITLRICPACVPDGPSPKESFAAGARQHFESMASVNKAKGSLLFVAGKEQVAVWSLKHGRVGEWNPEHAVMEHDEEAWAERLREARESDDDPLLKPVCVYQRPGTTLEVDQIGMSVSWAAQIQGDGKTVEVWGLDVAEPHRFALEPESIANLLICPGEERTKVLLSHRTKVLDMIVVEDSDGPGVVSACAGGKIVMWDLEGHSMGQRYAEMRSLKPWEFLLPPAILLVTVAQMFSFAFGPAVPWDANTRQNAHAVYEVMMMDFKVRLKVNKAAIFWPEMYTVCFAVVLFNVCAMIGASERLDAAVRNAQDAGWPDFAMRLVKGCRALCNLTMRLLSTVFIVPLIQSCCQAVDCVRPDDVPWYEMFTGNPNDKIYLDAAPTIMCYKGTHLRLVMVLFFTVPPFLFLVVPYAVVDGNASYVPRSTLFHCRFWYPDNAWRAAAARVSTNLHMAFLSRIPEQAFGTLFTEVGAKIALPMVTTWTTSQPGFQMASVTIVNFGLWWYSLLNAPYVERKTCVVYQDLRFLPVCASASGLLSVYLNGKQPHLPITLLSIACAVVLTSMFVKLYHISARRPFVHKQAAPCTTSTHLDNAALEPEEIAPGEADLVDTGMVSGHGAEKEEATYLESDISPQENDISPHEVAWKGPGSHQKSKRTSRTGSKVVPIEAAE